MNDTAVSFAAGGRVRVNVVFLPLALFLDSLLLRAPEVTKRELIPRSKQRLEYSKADVRQRRTSTRLIP